jgi:hypothetical protein
MSLGPHGLIPPRASTWAYIIYTSLFIPLPTSAMTHHHHDHPCRNQASDLTHLGVTKTKSMFTIRENNGTTTDQATLARNTPCSLCPPHIKSLICPSPLLYPVQLHLGLIPGPPKWPQHVL